MAEVAAAQNLPHLETEHFEALTLEDIQQKNAGLAGGFHGKMIYKWRSNGGFHGKIAMENGQT
jgi:hypothetical protein